MIDLSQLTIDSTIGELPHYKFEVKCDARVNDIAKRFEQDSQVPGVIILDQDSLILTMISRRKFLERMSKPYSIELFTKQPVRKILPFIKERPIRLSADHKINEAGRIVLSRPDENGYGYEPIIVISREHGLGLIDCNVIFLAQSKILGLVNKKLETTLQYLEYSENELKESIRCVMAMNTQLTEEIAERRKAEEQLSHDALHDALTGLPNRVLLMARLQQAFKRYERDKIHLFGVMFLDLDRFKVINDSLGHAAGDQLLIEVSDRLGKCLRTVDTIARLGGDEFAIHLDHIRDLKETEVCAKRIQKRLSEPFNLDGNEVFIGVSIGIAIVSNDYKEPEELLRDADIAMYQAKRQGRSCHRIFNNDMYMNAITLLNSEQDLRRALTQQELRVYYQPIYSLHTHALVGLEALVRWQHPQKDLLLPIDFMAIAQETGLIVKIDWWIMRQACEQMVRWQSQFAHAANLTISVNLSSQHFRQTEMASKVEFILAESGLEPKYLRLEVTEAVIMENVEAVTTALNQLQDLQIKLNIDDFGAGYSSLSRLNALPIDVLKIDRSFVNQLHYPAGNQEFFKAILALSKHMGMDVIAKGIETPEQERQLQELGYEYAQGYLFSKPLSAELTEELIAKCFSAVQLQ